MRNYLILKGVVVDLDERRCRDSIGMQITRVCVCFLRLSGDVDGRIGTEAQHREAVV